MPNKRHIIRQLFLKILERNLSASHNLQAVALMK